ncbi:hypothetical protein [Undibacterium terreum]|uniref:Uncharacterized protein n=1 Tax=Undibacterium terreum TaxID=1224302 RepID=A0A916XB84_9BURK|nr:hypothetical protein [Undibacterium terreum]GGC58053.1 hypothetical protein GCM10011396_01080 [Undibacterium terreum]
MSEVTIKIGITDQMVNLTRVPCVGEIISIKRKDNERLMHLRIDNVMHMADAIPEYIAPGTASGQAEELIPYHAIVHVTELRA